MIINNRYKFVYLHVPKTAGTTISTVLHEMSGPTDIDLGGVLNNKAKSLNVLWQEEWGLSKHSPLRQVREVMSPDVWQEYFSFAFVRNPFARAYSAFRFAKKMGVVAEKLKGMTFHDYLRSELFEKRVIGGSRSQVDFLHPISELSMLGRYENLEEDLNLALQIITRKRLPAISLQRLNQSSDSEEWRGMSEDDKDIIRNAYARDFDELGYDLEDGRLIADF